MSEDEYAGEGLCHDCFYDKILEEEAKLNDITIEGELEDVVDEIMLVLYDKQEGDDV